MGRNRIEAKRGTGSTDSNRKCILHTIIGLTDRTLHREEILAHGQRHLSEVDSIVGFLPLRMQR